MVFLHDPNKLNLYNMELALLDPGLCRSCAAVFDENVSGSDEWVLTRFSILELHGSDTDWLRCIDSSTRLTDGLKGNIKKLEHSFSN